MSRTNELDRFDFWLDDRLIVKLRDGDYVNAQEAIDIILELEAETKTLHARVAELEALHLEDTEPSKWPPPPWLS